MEKLKTIIEVEMEKAGWHFNQAAGTEGEWEHPDFNQGSTAFVEDSAVATVNALRRLEIVLS